MRSQNSAVLLLAPFLHHATETGAFSPGRLPELRYVPRMRLHLSDGVENGCNVGVPEFQSSLPDTAPSNVSTRRSILSKVVGSVVLGSAVLADSQPARASVGTLPEYADTNAILQGVTVDVADLSQQNAMIKFLETGFDFKVLRRRQSGTVTDTWLGFGPEQLSIPSDFQLPVSSFAMYGGHASIHIRYDSQSTDVLYKTGDSAPGNNIAFLQVGVPTYRVSQLVKNSGNIIDAYGFINVVSPCGLPMRAIIGIHPDPMMFVALNCQDVEQSRAFYERLGFVEQEYPYARPSKGKGDFEPAQPPKSVYLAPSPNCMGVLLLQNKDKKKKVTTNPVLRSMNIVYTPSSEGGSSSSEGGEMRVMDPLGVPISFVSVDRFEQEERSTKSSVAMAQNQ